MNMIAVHRSLDAYRFRCELEPSYVGLDLQGLVNNVAVQALHYEAVVRFQRAVFGDDCWRSPAGLLHPAWMETRFARITEYGAAVTCGVPLLAVDSGGCTIASALFQQGECVGVQEHRLVAWAQGRPAPLHAGQQAALAARLAHGAAPEGEPLEAPSWDVALQPGDARTVLTTRFADLDATGCIGSLQMIRYTEQARVTFLFAAARAGGVDLILGPVDCLLVSSRVRFELREPAPQSVLLAHRLGRLGTSSFSVQTAVYDQGRCLALNEGVLVCVGRDGGRPTAVPEAFRQGLQSVR